MDDLKICSICNKSFANGKAMGGHMRSHFAKLPVALRPEPLRSPTRLISAIRSPSSSSGSDSIAINPRSVESFRNPTRKRSERVQHRKTIAESQSASPAISESFSDVEVAMCLMTLLNEKWPKEGEPGMEPIQYKDENSKESKKDDDEDDEEDDDSSCSKSRASKSNGKYKCGTCNRVFGSYQALGGHRASHNNKRAKIEENKYGFIGHRSFECSLCDKVFGSGQALGGHKKSHFSSLATAKIKNFGRPFFDLNLPADDDYEDEGAEHFQGSDAKLKN